MHVRVAQIGVPPGALVDGDAFVVKYVLRKHVWASTGWYRLEALADLFPDGWTTDDLVKLQVGMSGPALMPDVPNGWGARAPPPSRCIKQLGGLECNALCNALCNAYIDIYCHSC